MRKLILVMGLATSFGLMHPASSVVGGGGAGSTTTTTSTTHHTTVTDLTPITVNNRGYSTQVLGVLSSSGGNTTVFNVTVDSGVDLDGLNQQFAQARQAIQTAHAQSGNRQLELSAARLQSSNSPLSTTATATNQTTSTQDSVETTSTLGPATILVGPDQSETFFVAAGSTNININTHTETFVTRQMTTTNRSVKSSVYQMVGVSTP